MELLASCSSPIGEGIGGFWDFTELYRICWKTKGTAVEGMCLVSIVLTPKEKM